MNFIEELNFEFNKIANKARAIEMENYMKNNFPFLGISAPIRQSILKKLIATHKDELITNYRSICKELYQISEREFHYTAIELLHTFFKKDINTEDIKLIYYFLENKAWWDSIDALAKYELGLYLKKFPKKRNLVLDKLCNSKNFWLNRSALLFQLSYKNETDNELLFVLCEQFKESDEFFIQKAIGWSLREYGTYNSNGVVQFVNNTHLKPLSKKEALRKIIKK